MSAIQNLKQNIKISTDNRNILDTWKTLTTEKQGRVIAVVWENHKSVFGKEYTQFNEK